LEEWSTHSNLNYLPFELERGDLQCCAVDLDYLFVVLDQGAHKGLFKFAISPQGLPGKIQAVNPDAKGQSMMILGDKVYVRKMPENPIQDVKQEVVNGRIHIPQTTYAHQSCTQVNLQGLELGNLLTLTSNHSGNSE
jgi:hypothetical protein